MQSNSFFFGDDTYAFGLTLPLALELERKCDVSLSSTIRSFYESNYRLHVVIETLRLALIGGGLDPEKAKNLVETYLLPMGLEKSRMIAMVVLAELMTGDTDEDISDDN